MNSRRDFLQQLTASIIALHLPAISAAGSKKIFKEPYEGPVLRVAIMGLGSYGNRVAEAMQACKMAKLTGVISGTPSKIKDWQGKYIKAEIVAERWIGPSERHRMEVLENGIPVTHLAQTN